EGAVFPEIPAHPEPELAPPGEFPLPVPGQTAPVETLAVMAIWASHAELSDEVAYAVVKAAYENTETLAKVHTQGKNITLATALQSVSIPLHPGAEKFYREKGVLK
ncbi:MAG: TAXI family TRAP transporter solute-binding subunit, partial [Oceanibaculum sp.]